MGISKNKPSSFLRWAGSKRKLLPILTEYWNPKFDCYIEPFAGSAQLFFSIDAKEYLISDKNHDLIETYLQIKKNPVGVYNHLKKLKNTKEDYYKIRSLEVSELNAKQRAARFIYLNWLCFNGLYRTNASGQFNVPYSGEIDKKLTNWNLLKNSSKKLELAKITEGDFEEVVYKNLQPNNFVYLDPPYAVENVKIFNQYGNHTFGKNDLKRLSDLLDFIHHSNSYFVVSYAKCDEALKLFSKWQMREVNVQRNIAGFAMHRKISTELLITNIQS